MRVLVTGGAGYIGSHVVRRLLVAGHEPVVVDSLAAGHRAAIFDVQLEVGDFADAELLARVGESGPIEAVVHLAGHALVGESVKDPARYLRNNVIRSFELLEWVRQAGWGGIVFSSSAAVYGEPDSIPIPEEHATRTTNPYGESKLMVEKALEAYHVAYDLPYVSLRYFNAAGADPNGDIGEDHGSKESHLIPNVLRTLIDGGGVLRIFGSDYPTSDGTAVRDYVHVNDLADAHVAALERIAARRAGIFNLGNGEGFSVNEVVAVCAKVAGREVPVEHAPRRPGDPAVLVASSARAQEELDWQPQHPRLEQIVATAWRWHEAHPGGFPKG